MDTFHVNVPFIGEVHAVELDIRSRAKTRTWFVESIDIEDATTKKKVHFSCSSWLVSSDPVMLFRKADGKYCKTGDMAWHILIKREPFKSLLSGT